MHKKTDAAYGQGEAHGKGSTVDRSNVVPLHGTDEITFIPPANLPLLTPDAARCLLTLIEGAHQRRHQQERTAS